MWRHKDFPRTERPRCCPVEQSGRRKGRGVGLLKKEARCRKCAHCQKDKCCWGRRRDEGAHPKQTLEWLNVMPEVVTYSALTSAHRKGARLEQALDILAAMRRQGVVPGAITYNALVSACEKGR